MSTRAAVVKKFINDPETVVPEALAALAYGFIAHTPADRAVSEGIDLADPDPSVTTATA